MKKVFAVVCTLVLVSQPLLADENPGKPGKGKSSVASVSEASSADAAKLPIRRVVLYKNGVGYFEHLGRVRGSQDVHIDFTSAQLNDVLKSLTVLDLSGGRITGVDYNSEARLALGERPTVMDFLGALRGARVEIRSGEGVAVAGKLLSVERKTRMGTAGSVEMEQISLVTDAGEVRNIDLNTSTSVRIADRDLNTEIGKYLGLVASARDQDTRRMTISTTGAGDRNLYVSYISEVPIWKTTYRIVLPSKEGKKPLLQGWAIVDNTVGEDWNDVELSLVAGAPHSFIQQLSEPYYGRRPVVDLPESVQLSPQTHAATLLGGSGRLSGQVTDASGAIVAGASVALKNENGGVIAQTSTDGNSQYSFDGIAAGNYRAEIQQTGFKKNDLMALHVGPGDNIVNSQLQVGATTETVEVTAETVSVNSSAASMQSGNFGKLGVANRPRSSPGFGAGEGGGVADGTGGGAFRAGINGRNAEGLAMLAPGAVENSIAQLNAAANGAGLGDLFEYKLKDRVTLKKNQSALVPIAQTEIEADKVSLWSGTSGAGRPLRAIWVKNTSPLTFDGGSFSVLDNEVFAGEGLTDPLKPDERRLLSYASDLGILVDAVQNSRPQHVTLAKISKGVLTQISAEEQRTLYTARSQEDSTRTLVVEHPARPGWTLKKGAQEPEEKSPGTYRFRVSLAAKATATLPIEEVRPVSAVYQLANLGPDQVQLFQKNGSLTLEMAAALQKITTQKAVVQKLEQEMDDRQKDIDRIVDDQGRLRENMKALRGSAEEKALLQRYTKQLDDQETQLAALRKKIQDTEAQRDAAQTQLETMIDELHLEASF